MTMVGYARVSSSSQCLELQEQQLAENGCEKLFSEKASGTSTGSRDALQDALEWLREGDTLVVTRLDRLARSGKDLHAIIDQLQAKQVGFRCLQQGAVDTTTSMGKLVLGILGAVAEFETDIRKERQREGIEKAKKRGVYKGRPASIDAGKIRSMNAAGLGASAIAKEMGIGRASVYRLLAVSESK
ncbi:recombinase family protein [Pontixanthobacter sp. CEM42]|uniref:recombinase family protein n=1 Tax=Pontixanthobacter sp. CEM42 TaxID=2792077 RepID=UPI001ADFD102|nr:recombinase family protein [Pontixanthobacter sp. CEM42]